MDINFEHNILISWKFTFCNFANRKNDKTRPIRNLA